MSQSTSRVSRTQTTTPVPRMLCEPFTKDALLWWFGGEFAAASAIIEELLAHITEVNGGDMKNYTAVFREMHVRRMNWLPVLRRQKFFPITEVVRELHEAAKKSREEMDGGDEVVEGGSCGSNESLRGHTASSFFQKRNSTSRVSEPPRLPMLMSGTQTTTPVPRMLCEPFTKDALLSWFRGEFAAADAIIEELLAHITELNGGDMKNYTAVFSAMHVRRMNWLPVLQRQKFFPITEFATELHKAAKMTREEMDGSDEVVPGGSGASNESHFQQMQHRLHCFKICSNHDDCEARRAQINVTQGFIVKEKVLGRRVNVLRGLKVYDDVFTDTELSKLTYYVNELRFAGQNGEFSGETFMMYNQARNKRELIQFGAPIFGDIKDVSTSQYLKGHIDPIPATLQGVIDHLVQWELIPENKKPNSCVIKFFDEGESSQPFMKPPHLDRPISTLLLAESKMAFGRTLACHKDGNYKGSLMLSLKEGSLLVMRGKCADLATHVMCSSQNRRISITFFRVRMNAHKNIPSPVPPVIGAMALWQHGVPYAYAANGAPRGYEAMDLVSKHGVLRSPMVMVPAAPRMVQSPTRISGGGTGVFLPWNANNSEKNIKHLPPHIQKVLCGQGSS